MKEAKEVYAEFAGWLGKQDFWMQDAAWRIYTGKEIDDKQIQEYAAMCLAQSRGEKDIKHHSMDVSTVMSKNKKGKMVVKRLHDISEVNGLGNNAELSFSGEGMTVVYGLNGAGKSSFMRIFKQVSSNPYKEIIQPNVFVKKAARVPRCTFDIVQESVESAVECDLASGEDTPLRDCDVFDTRISGAYITKPNAASYQPFVFTVLSQLANVADRIGRHLESESSKIDCIPIVRPEEFKGIDKLEWLDTLTEKSVFPREYAEWSAANEGELQALIHQLDADTVNGKIKTLQSDTEFIRLVLEDLQQINKRRSEEKLTKAYQTYSESRDNYLLAQELFNESANKYDKVSSSLTCWRDLWRMAKQYYETELAEKEGVKFAEEGSICPLCHQHIAGDVLTRFNRVNEYVNGTCSEEYTETRNTLNAMIDAVCEKKVMASEVSRRLKGIIAIDDLNVVTAVYVAIEAASLQEKIETKYADCCKIDIEDAIRRIGEALKTKRALLKTFEASLQDEGRQKLEVMCLNLKVHKWSYQQKEAINHNIQVLQSKKELDEARQLIKTNKITRKANEMASELITDAYVERFIGELHRLAPKLRVKLEKAKSKKGNSPYQIILDGANTTNSKPEDILSEGEQRIVALAAFFADATGRTEVTPIIIDDPISSLDINYEKKATQRIVELAKERQVIVFTHRISLLVGLDDACVATGVPFSAQYIRGTSKGKGLPDFADVYRGKLGAQLGALKNKVVQIKKMDVDSQGYMDAVGRINQQFRICVERSVEETLLQGMVRRFNRNIMTKNKVTKLTLITDDDCKIIDDFMTKYSFGEHSQPIDCIEEPIPVEEIECDIDRLMKWQKEFNSKLNPKK